MYDQVKVDGYNLPEVLPDHLIPPSHKHVNGKLVVTVEEEWELYLDHLSALICVNIRLLSFMKVLTSQQIGSNMHLPSTQ